MTSRYDPVINKGRVMDPETMLDALVNVGGKNCKILAVTKNKITGKETIDATGYVVAPDLIDTHFHFHFLAGLSLKWRRGTV